MDPEKSILNRCQEIEYLGFVINSIKNDSSLTPAKEQKILLLFVKVLAEHAGSRFTTEQARIRYNFWGVFQIALLQCLMVNFVIDP